MAGFNIEKRTIGMDEIIDEVGEDDLNSLLNFGSLIRPLSINAKTLILDTVIRESITTAQDEISFMISIMTDRITQSCDNNEAQGVLEQISYMLKAAVDIRLKDNEPNDGVKH